MRLHFLIQMVEVGRYVGVEVEDMVRGDLC